MQMNTRIMASEKLNLTEEFRQTDIFKAACEKDSRETLRYINDGSDVNFLCDNTGNSFLHVIMIEASPITETKFVSMVYQLSLANANLDVLNKNGASPLDLAIKGHLLELMVALVKCGAFCDIEKDMELITSCSGPVECEFRSAYRKFAPGYWLPVEEDKAFKVNVLVKSWCRINISKNGKTLIEFAKEKNAQEKIVKMLIANEVSIEFAHATIAGDAARMNDLLQHHTVDLDTKDYSHKENYFEPYFPLTLYGAAIKYGHKHIMCYVKATSDVSVTSKVNKEHGASGLVSRRPSSSSVCVII